MTQHAFGLWPFMLLLLLLPELPGTRGISEQAKANEAKGKQEGGDTTDKTVYVVALALGILLCTMSTIVYFLALRQSGREEAVSVFSNLAFLGSFLGACVVFSMVPFASHDTAKCTESAMLTHFCALCCTCCLVWQVLSRALVLARFPRRTQRSVPRQLAALLVFSVGCPMPAMLVTATSLREQYVQNPNTATKLGTWCWISPKGVWGLLGPLLVMELLVLLETTRSLKYHNTGWDQASRRTVSKLKQELAAVFLLSVLVCSLWTTAAAYLSFHVQEAAYVLVVLVGLLGAHMLVFFHGSYSRVAMFSRFQFALERTDQTVARTPEKPMEPVPLPQKKRHITFAEGEALKEPPSTVDGKIQAGAGQATPKRSVSESDPSPSHSSQSTSLGPPSPHISFSQLHDSDADLRLLRVYEKSLPSMGVAVDEFQGAEVTTRSSSQGAVTASSQGRKGEGRRSRSGSRVRRQKGEEEALSSSSASSSFATDTDGLFTTSEHVSTETSTAVRESDGSAKTKKDPETERLPVTSRSLDDILEVLSLGSRVSERSARVEEWLAASGAPSEDTESDRDAGSCKEASTAGRRGARVDEILRTRILPVGRDTAGRKATPREGFSPAEAEPAGRSTQASPTSKEGQN